MCDARWCMMRCQLLSGPSRRGGSSDPCQWFCFLLSPLPFHSFCGLCWRPSIGLNSMRGSIIFFLLVSKVKIYLGGPPPTFSGYILARIAPEVPLYNLLRTLPFQHKYISLTSEEFQKKNIYIYIYEDNPNNILSYRQSFKYYLRTSPTLARSYMHLQHANLPCMETLCSAQELTQT